MLLRTQRLIYACTRLVARAAFSSVRSHSNVMENTQFIKEVRFPVPWGYIAGREWGDPSGTPVLALHGWLDNAGSFDKIIPLLSKSLHVVAIDFPGHGQSSHRPIGSLYHVQDYIADVKYVVDALKWEKFAFLAHSLGAGVATWFTAALPELVESAVFIEGLGFWPTVTEELPSRMGNALRKLGSLSDKDTKVYPTWDALVDRVLEGHLNLDKGFSSEAAATLAIRGSRQTEAGGYQFTRDLRVKAPSLLRMPASVNFTFIKAIQCPVLVIVARNTILPVAEFNSMLGALDSTQLKFVKVSGGHHVHLCQPEVMDRLVDTFILTKDVHTDFEETSKL